MKNYFKGWKIGDYIRQFSIVTGGVLLTLWMTGKVSEAAKQREVRQAIQLVTLELRDNLRIMHAYGKRFEEEKRVALRIMEDKFSTAAMHKDSIAYYQWRLFTDFGQPFVFSTDALEMFKASGIATNISNKQQVVELLRCYKELEVFVSETAFYATQRRETVFPFIMDESRSGQGFLSEEFFGWAMRDASIRRWIMMLPKIFNDAYFENFESDLSKAIDKIEEAYKL